MQLVLGLDIGSSAVKAAILDVDNMKTVALARVIYPRNSPNRGELEIPLDHLEQAVTQVLCKLPLNFKTHVVSLAITGQMAGLIILDRDLRPVGPCLSIFDGRAMDESEQLNQKYANHLREYEGNEALPIHTLPKVLWLRRYSPERYQKARLFVLPKDYIRGLLTGSWGTDPSDASGTLAFDQTKGMWDHTLLSELGLDSRVWPDVWPSDAVTGYLVGEWARRVSLPLGLPIVVGAADMACVPIGTNAIEETDLVISIGTAAHVIAPTQAFNPHSWPIQQYAQAIPNYWYQFGAVFTGGAAFDWILSVTRQQNQYKRFSLENIGSAVEEPVFVPYLAGAGVPYNNPRARGAFMGLSIGHGSDDLARAVMWGVIAEIATIRSAIDVGHHRRSIHITGGGARMNGLVQALANMLDTSVNVHRELESVAVGAAILAARGVGINISVPHLATVTVSPDLNHAQFYRIIQSRYERAAAMVREI